MNNYLICFKYLKYSQDDTFPTCEFTSARIKTSETSMWQEFNLHIYHMSKTIRPCWFFGEDGILPLQRLESASS